MPPYREPVGWLRCFRGLDTLSAMILVGEIVDFQRFQRPCELMAYLGLVPSEPSSGQTERRGAITKAGITHARRVLVEAAWHHRHRPRLSRALTERSGGQPSVVVSPAWRAQQRLGCTSAIAISSGTANAHRSPWRRSRANWSASSWAAMTRRPAAA
jgi:transposase